MPLSTEGTGDKLPQRLRPGWLPSSPQLLGTARICLILITKAQVWSLSMFDVTDFDSVSAAKTVSPLLTTGP